MGWGVWGVVNDLRKGRRGRWRRRRSRRRRTHDCTVARNLAAGLLITVGQEGNVCGNVITVAITYDFHNPTLLPKVELSVEKLQTEGTRHHEHRGQS